MTDPTTMLRCSMTVEDFTLENAKYPEEVWATAVEITTMQLMDEARKRGREAYNIQEKTRLRYKMVFVPEEDGGPGYKQTPCHPEDADAEGWQLIMSADTRPLDSSSTP